MPWPCRLMSDLAVFFSESILSPSWIQGFFYSEAVIVRIDGVCLELGEFYGL